MNEWISVKDQPIPPYEKVLAIFKSEKDKLYNLNHLGWFRDTIYSCRVDEGNFIIESHGPIFPATHWMPLPDLPKD